jgi:hypothetical protein
MELTTERWQTTPWWRLFGSTFIVIFAVIAIWSIAMPSLSGPDERTHVVKATAVIRGQFTGSCNGGVCAKSSASTEVHVPGFFTFLPPLGDTSTLTRYHGVACFGHKVDIPASCVIYATNAQYKNVVSEAWIYDGRYPPMYYVIVGIPSLFGQGLWVVYLMRLFSAAASALLLAAAIFAVLRYTKNRLYLLGIVIAATPMVVYLSSVVNASGLEVSAALCFWVTVSMMMYQDKPPRALVVIASLSALVFVSSRSLSPLWLVLGCLAIACSSNFARIKDLLRRRDVQIGLLLLVIVGCADVFWIIYENATAVHVSSVAAQSLIPKPGTSELTILRTSFHHNIYYLPGMIGVFGSFDTYAPRLSFVIWYLLGGSLFIFGVIATNMRRGLVLVALALGILLLPVIISSSQARHIGYVWSGRDTLPFAVGLPILCAAALDGGRYARILHRCSPVLLLLAFIAQVGAFFEALRRYSVGDAGAKISFLLHPSWSPPIVGNIGALIIEVIVLAAAYRLVLLALGIDFAFPRTRATAVEDQLNDPVDVPVELNAHP